MSKKFLKVKDVADQLMVSPSSVRAYVNSGKLECSKTPYGQRVFTQRQVDNFIGKKEAKEFVFYVRSSNGDKNLIESQVSLLSKTYGHPKKVYKDNASGLNENRKGLQQLIKDAKNNEFSIVCVTEKDRLTRFGFSYIKDHLETLNVDLLTLSATESKSPSEELLQDFMSLLASFSGKFYRLRGFHQQKMLLSRAGEAIDEKENSE